MRSDSHRGGFCRSACPPASSGPDRSPPGPLVVNHGLPLAERGGVEMLADVSLGSRALTLSIFFVEREPRRSIFQGIDVAKRYDAPAVVNSLGIASDCVGNGGPAARHR